MVSSFLQSATKNEGVQISAKCTWWRPLDRCSRETVGFCKTVFRYLLSLHQSKFKEKVYRCLILSKHKMQWMNFAPWYPTACDVQLTMLQSRWKNAPDGGESQLPKYTVGSCKTKQTLSRRQPLSKKPGLVLWGSQHRQNTKLVLWGSQHTHRSCEGACEYKCEIMIHYQSTAKYLTACWSRKGAQQALVPIQTQTSQKEDTVIHRHVRSVLQSCAAEAKNKSGYVYLAGKIQESQANCTCLSSRLHNPMFDANLPFIQTSMHQLFRRAGRGQNCWIKWMRIYVL